MIVYVGFVCDIIETHQHGEMNLAEMQLLNQRTKEAWPASAERFSQGVCGRMRESDKRWGTSKPGFPSEA